MIPFRLAFRPGVPLCEQVVYAAKRAIISGSMRPGDPFPSVRALSRELKINPNTAHKAVSQLVSEGMLEIHIGLGAVVSPLGSSTAAERSKLLKGTLEELVVEAKKLSIGLDQVIEALTQHWLRLGRSYESKGGLK